jgi:hypothetical protein
MTMFEELPLDEDTLSPKELSDIADFLLSPMIDLLIDEQRALNEGISDPEALGQWRHEVDPEILAEFDDDRPELKSDLFERLKADAIAHRKKS